jgi:hypothetical protein
MRSKRRPTTLVVIPLMLRPITEFWTARRSYSSATIRLASPLPISARVLLTCPTTFLSISAVSARIAPSSKHPFSHSSTSTVHKRRSVELVFQMTPKSVLLKSKRGTRVAGGVLCKQCRKNAAVWRYEDSNYGVVFICGACKPKVLNRSFGRRDALDSSISGGGFETNRRKH